MSALYNRDILRLAVASADHPLTPDLSTIERRAPLCGSRVTLGLGWDGVRVARVGLSVTACALGQASAALFARGAPGRTRADLLAARAAVAAWLGAGGAVPDWPGLHLLAAARNHPARHGAILLPFDAAATLAARVEEARDLA